MTDFIIADEDSLVVTLGKSDLTIETSVVRSLELEVQGPVAISIDFDIDPLFEAGSGGNGTGFVNQAEWLVIEKIAGETISALALVRFSSATTVVNSTNNEDYFHAKVTGIALNGAATGGTVRVLIFGIVEDPFFTYPANTLLFLGINGTITATPPTTGFLSIIGEAPAVGLISLSIREPKIL